MALFRINNGDGKSVVSGKIASLQIPRNGVSKQVGELYIVKDGVMRNALADAHLWRKYELVEGTKKVYMPSWQGVNWRGDSGIVQYSTNYSFNRDTGECALINPIEGRYIEDYYPVYKQYPYISRGGFIYHILGIEYVVNPPGYSTKAETLLIESINVPTLEPGELLGYVTSTDSSAYPSEDFDGDYWYAKIE